MPHDLFNSFVCNIKKLLLFGLFLPKENYHNLMKNSPKFQANVTERRTSLSKRPRMFRQNLLNAPVKKLNLKKSITAHELLHK